MRQAGAARVPKPNFTVKDAVVPEPVKADVPQWKDVHGNMHHDFDSAVEVNLKFAVTQVMEFDFRQHVGGGDDDPEDYVERIVRQQQFLLVALRTPDKDDESDKYRFRRFMTAYFGQEYEKDTSDEARAVRKAMEDAFLAGMAQP